MTGIYLHYLQTTNINFLKLPKVDIVREVQELFHHTVGRHHTLSLRNSYNFRFMVKIILIIPYASSTY